MQGHANYLDVDTECTHLQGEHAQVLVVCRERVGTYCLAAESGVKSRGALRQRRQGVPPKERPVFIQHHTPHRRL